MVYMFNELSLSQLNSIQEARNVLETFVKSSIRARQLGFDQMRLDGSSLSNLYEILLLDGYRIDTWLNDQDVNLDLRDSFRDIVSSSPLITEEEISEIELYSRSEFHKILDKTKYQVFGLGAAHVYGTLAISLASNQEWLKSTILIEHYSISHDGTENAAEREVLHFASQELLQLHQQWIENEQRESLEKSIELWNKRKELFPNILFGLDLENQVKKIGLTKRFAQIFDCLKKLDAFALSWTNDGFDLNKLKAESMMDISGESATTMQKYSVERKFRLADGQKTQFELKIKIPDIRIYFLPDETTRKITVGYIGKHLRTAKYN